MLNSIFSEVFVRWLAVFGCGIALLVSLPASAEGQSDVTLSVCVVISRSARNAVKSANSPSGNAVAYQAKALPASPAIVSRKNTAGDRMVNGT